MKRDDFDRAAEFIWRHARLLDRRRFAHTFDSHDPDGVAAAVLAYRNPDGGFGNALEPDCRTPHSQPQATKIGLEVLAEVDRLDEEVAQAAAAWLSTIADTDGGVPFCLPTVAGFPRAPWWEPEGDPPRPNINPTAALVGRLRHAGLGDAWLDRAELWCFDEFERRFDAGDVPSQYDVPCLAELCAHGLDRERAHRGLDRLRDLLRSGAIIPLDPADRGGEDTHTPLQMAPRPDHPLWASFTDDVIDGFLDRLETDQQEDGGWSITWPAPGETAILEWRGERTFDALRTLHAYGRLAV